MAMLKVTDLTVNYGVIQAVKGISFEVEEGEIVALIGANGAGKTTTLHTITGMIPARTGTIEFHGTDITKVPAHKIVSMGLAHVPEGRRVFAQLTVLENLKMGAYTRKDKDEIGKSLEEIYKRFPRLKERKNQPAGTLSGGEQQMLAMGRKIIQEINDSGTTVLLVEQNAKKALAIADKAYVLETGNIVLSGKASDLMNDDSVKKAYLSE